MVQTIPQLTRSSGIYLCTSYTYAHHIPMDITYLCTSHTCAHHIPMHITYLCTSHTCAHHIPMHITYLCTSHTYAHHIPVHITGHRGEVYSLKHGELFCDEHGIRDEPVITKHSQEGTTSADHACLVHSGTGPYCNPYARQVCT